MRLPSMVVFVLALVLAAFSAAAHANCEPHAFSDPKQMRLAPVPLMLVAHASTVFDARLASKRGIDEAVDFARRKRIQVVYLQDSSPDRSYFMANCFPDHWVFSESGEVPFDVPASQLFVAGGHLELCLDHALHEVLYKWARQPRHDFTVTYFMDAIYSNGKSVDGNFPWGDEFWRLMRILTYGRDASESWPKVTLLETMGVIIKEHLQVQYLESILPHWQRTFPKDFRVELRLNDSPAKVLQKGEGAKPPVLKFQFYDSAITLRM